MARFSIAYNYLPTGFTILHSVSLFSFLGFGLLGEGNKDNWAVVKANLCAVRAVYTSQLSVTPICYLTSVVLGISVAAGNLGVVIISRSLENSKTVALWQC